MSKGIKLKNNTYLDSSGIIHKNTSNIRKNLKDILNELTGDVIWRNSNSNNDYSSGNIGGLNLTDYKWFKVVFRVEKNDGQFCSFDVPFKDSDFRYGAQKWSSIANADVSTNRSVRITNTNIIFSVCIAYGVGNYTYTNTNMESTMIPHQVVGYKYDWDRNII